MQGHRGQGNNHKCSKVQGLWAVLEHFHYAQSINLGDLVVAGTLPNAGAFGNLDS